MQLASYESLLRRVLSRLGENYDLVQGSGTTGPDAQRWRDVRDAISEALETWWYSAWWPAICRVERRPLRVAYDGGTTYVTGTEVWHEPSAKYYHAVTDVPLEEEPATYDGTEWDVNSSYWAESKRKYGAQDYDATTAYVVGDQVFHPETARYYQCHAAATGEAPTETDFWGPLVEFIPTLPRVMDGFANIGHVRGMFAQDPRRYAEASPIDYEEVEDGWQVLDEGHVWPWVVYRLRCPRLEGLALDTSASYTPSDDEGAGVIQFTTVMSSDRAIPGRTSLRARTSHRDRQMAYLAFLVTAGDNVGGEFIYDATSTATDDGVDVLKPDNVDAADPGRWIRSGNVT